MPYTTEDRRPVTDLEVDKSHGHGSRDGGSESGSGTCRRQADARKDPGETHQSSIRT